MRYNHQGLGGVLYQKVYQEQPAGPVGGAQHESETLLHIPPQKHLVRADYRPTNRKATLSTG